MDWLCARTMSRSRLNFASETGKRAGQDAKKRSGRGDAAALGDAADQRAESRRRDVAERYCRSMALDGGSADLSFSVPVKVRWR